MTSSVVIDSGLLLATYLIETYSEKAVQLFASWEQQNVKLAAPMQFHYEIVSVIRNKVYRKQLTPDEGLFARNQLLARPVHLLMDTELVKQAYDLAAKYNRPTVYDAQYLAVALRLNCDFWTADEKLYNATRHDLPWVKWIGNFSA